MAGILCSASLTLPCYLLYLLLPITSGTFLYRKFRLFSDLLLLWGFFLCGNLLPATSPPFIPNNNIYFFKGECTEVLAHYNYILAHRNQKFYLANFYTDTLYQPGDSLCFCTRIFPLSGTSASDGNTYTRYLQQKNVYSRLVPASRIQISGKSHRLKYYFASIRQQLLEKNARLIKDSTCLQLINALCLGFRIDIDNQLQQLFISTGTIHLLSVSGLHTGAIYVLILFILKHTGIKGHRREMLALPFLWGYACLTGMSPSVVRASNILTFITAGNVFHRSYTPVNSIAASAFLTLLFRPALLFSPGFLMSYSAYTGIILLYPMLYHPKKLPALFSGIYACCCLTIAAQIPTLPISAYYFHSINLNGFLTNIVAVPAATVLLYSATLFILLPSAIGTYLAPVIEFGCRLLIKILHIFQPVMLNLHHLYPTLPLVLLVYAGMICMVLYLIHRKKRWLKYSCYSLGLLIIYLSTHNFCLARQQEILIFHHSRHSLIILNDKGYYSLIRNTTPNIDKLKPYLYQNRLSAAPPAAGLLSGEYIWYKESLHYWRDTLTIATPATPINPVCHTLIITGNASPVQLFDSLATVYPATVILDGSNSRYNQRRWSEFCENRHISFRTTHEEGSISITLK